ncbi:thioesterase [Acinetobacter wanghuae]|uniref:Thioesterase n=1 Tax=Acinetobacter wanghuae TaxID=2662362 RepID=A0A5Q0P404_9GAMM|nr:PaaI family thioesterase [Acinetobacter wanghuae]MQW91814.1 thioesterase [Acinetobacter wanghuae]QGA11476.1 thioesterase [Acinetobacter wanghuae]
MKSNILEIQQFLAQEFPQSLQKCAVIDVQSKYAQVSYRVDEQELRPGGTVSGPTIMTIADFALYVAILAEMGIVALAVTSNMNIHFLRKPDGSRNLVAEARLIKVGRVLVVGEVWVYSEGIDDPVAHVTGSYSLPIKA